VGTQLVGRGRQAGPLDAGADGMPGSLCQGRGCWELALAPLFFQATSTPASLCPRSALARRLPWRRGSRPVPTATRPPPPPAAPPRARLCLPHSTSARRCRSSSKACAGGPPRQVRAQGQSQPCPASLLLHTALAAPSLALLSVGQG